MWRFLQKTYFITYRGEDGTIGSVLATGWKGQSVMQFYSKAFDRIKKHNPGENITITNFKRIK